MFQLTHGLQLTNSLCKAHKSSFFERFPHWQAGEEKNTMPMCILHTHSLKFSRLFTPFHSFYLDEGDIYTHSKMWYIATCAYNYYYYSMMTIYVYIYMSLLILTTPHRSHYHSHQHHTRRRRVHTSKWEKRKACL